MAKRNVQLTDEIVGARGRRTTAITLVVALVVVVMANWGAQTTLTKYTPNMGYWLIHEKWTRLESLDKPVDWLMLGDSSCNQGVRPDVWSQVGLGSAVNLCTIGDMTAINDAWMLETYLAKHPPPKAVVLVHVYDAWHRASGVLRHSLLGKIPLNYGFWDRMNPKVELTSKQNLNFLLTRYFPLYSDNKSLAKWALSPTTQAFSVDEHGYMSWGKADPAQVHADLERHKRFLRDREFALSRDNGEALERLRALANERGFDVYIANGPIYEELRRQPTFRAYLAQLNAEMRRFTNSSPRLHFVLQDPPTFQADEMVNCDHLIDDAARVYTEELAAAVKASQAP
jgi:hypothetical protein